MKYVFVTTGDLCQLSSFARLKYLGQYLAKLGIEVFYLCDDTSYNQKLVGLLDYSKVILVQRSVSGMTFRPRQTLLRRDKLKFVNADIVHFLNPSPNNTATIAGVKTFLISDWDELLSERIPSWGHRLANRICESIARQQADLTVVASKHLQKYFENKFNLKALYLPYAAYLQNTDIGQNPFSRPTAVYLGNFHQDGDHDILINAWEALEAGGTAPPLHLIGGGSCLEAVKAEVVKRGLKSLTFLGYQPVQTNQNYLRHAHILLFPIRDTIGNNMRCPSKTFAYMQAGRPIVTCQVGEVAEALGTQGIYVESTPDSFAKKVTEMFSKSLANVDYDLERHSWQERAQKLLAAIQEKL